MGDGAFKAATGKLRAAARDLYTPPQKADEALGLLQSDFPDVIVEVWPENWRTVEFFAAMSTQWQIAANGVIGLRYEAFEQVRHAHQIDAADWPEMFDHLRVMEHAALDVLRAAK